ncbi:alpha/beta hydrolase [Bradyrhizobium sp. NBAIM14]|uniref:esterase/lipase family protein n=1 Tax=Bradyrhizobium sp. NBAIM14 TaxID=2793814 RepID=UPI001CD6CF32|nr:alpha/beta hydrolase [Bradyrhizobium sp. NBAIM14]MCA1495853.1 hypothetical protein [Bradyrhizobium sp. NBAIM14]
MIEDAAPTHAITLIHGTFAADAEWVRPTSSMRIALSALYGDRCLVAPFHWNGANNSFERILAARDLIAHLRAVEATHPNIRHVLIAHSHGGNLALQAASHGSLSRPIDGICCLATPFFHSRLRHGADLSGKFICSVILALLMVPYFIVNMIIGISLFWSFVYLVIVVIVSNGVAAFLSGGVDSLRPLAENIVHWTHARSPTTNLKILRAPGDEASLVLSFGQLTAWVSRHSTEKLARAEQKNPFYLRVRGQKLPSFVRNAAVVLSILTAIAVVLIFAAPTTVVALLPWLGGAIAAFLFLVLLIKTTWFDRLLFGLATAALIVSLLLNRFLLGTSIPKHVREGSGIRFPIFVVSAGLLALMIEINTESAPEGEWNVEMLSPLPGSSFGELSHSIYNHPVAIDRVVEWVAVLMNNGDVSPR